MVKQRKKVNVAIFASGAGSNFSNLVQAARKGRLNARIVLLVCDNPGAGVLQRARRAGVPAELIKADDFSSRARFEREILRVLGDYKIQVIALAGFMRMLSPDFVRRYKNRILNIHPALLPVFKGARAIGDAYNYGVKVTGVTVHFVDEQMDHGPIILQQAIGISEKDTLRSLEAKIHRLEHKLYPEALRLVVEGKFKVRGRIVRRVNP